MLSEVKGLANSPKILYITQREFLNLNCLHRDQYIWQRWSCFDFNSVSAPLPCYLSKGPLKRDFLNIYKITFFGVGKFKNTSALRVIFFWEMFKIESKFRKFKKKLENIFHFWDNCIWKCCYKFSLLRRKHLFLAVNGLTNSPEIPHITQRDFFNLNCLKWDQ